MGARITTLPHNSLPRKVFPSSYPPPVSKHSAHHLSMMMMMMIMLINSSILGDKFIKPYSLLIVNEKYITVYNRDLKGGCMGIIFSLKGRYPPFFSHIKSAFLLPYNLLLSNHSNSSLPPSFQVQ